MQCTVRKYAPTYGYACATKRSHRDLFLLPQMVLNGSLDPMATELSCSCDTQHRSRVEMNEFPPPPPLPFLPAYLRPTSGLDLLCSWA